MNYDFEHLPDTGHGPYWGEDEPYPDIHHQGETFTFIDAGIERAAYALPDGRVLKVDRQPPWEGGSGRFVSQSDRELARLLDYDSPERHLLPALYDHGTTADGRVWLVLERCVSGDDAGMTWDESETLLPRFCRVRDVHPGNLGFSRSGHLRVLDAGF